MNTKPFGICKVSIAPLRAEKSDASEIETQLLFGDPVRVLEYGEPWIKVHHIRDDYQGWMDFKQLEYLNDNEYKLYISSNFTTINAAFHKAISDEGEIYLMMGSQLPNLENLTFHIGSSAYTLREALQPKKTLIETALEFANTPYLWGGKHVFGVDCSGLMQIVAKVQGFDLPRNASQQVVCGTEITFGDEQPGDMIFFINDKGKVHHVGWILANNKVLHASGHVRIDSYDEKGIFREDFQRYTHKHHSIRRL